MADPSSSVVAEKAALKAHHDRDGSGESVSSTLAAPTSQATSPQTASSQTTFHEHNFTTDGRPATPPPYSGPTSPLHAPPSHQSRSRNEPRHYAGLPRLDYQLYCPPLFELSQDCTTLSSKAQYLSESADALVNLLRSQATIPPKPQIHVVGTRGRRVDFDIKLNLMSTLIPEDPKQRLDYVSCVRSGELAYRGGIKPDVLPEIGDGGLEEWCRRFVEDKAQVKSFTLSRAVANLDSAWIEGKLRSLIASTGYKGVVSVTFPVTHARVVVQNPDRVNKFFTSVTTLFSGKHKYEVVYAVWPFATSRNGDEGERRCVVQSEAAWWSEWQDSIKYAVVTKRHGWVTNEDKLEALMEGKGKGVDIVDWGPVE
ncbi:uncharacterized protein DNG_05300 [Cephalotrichum gorgonifer]|uniref:Uncharacterized protein n=1 Tax=Cephalotrichum gorgonifer TaxID=2041049 RepID=A0AAE8SW54_9PEZI|nr:uncharacterized protein DNG_05300 [Cephalotrichum gorgonifer]